MKTRSVKYMQQRKLKGWQLRFMQMIGRTTRGKAKVTIIRLSIVLCLFSSCTKEAPVAPVQHKQFTAVMNIQRDAETNYYDVFVTNDTTLNPLQWNIWAVRSTDGRSVEFDFAGYVCMDYTVNPGKPLYGIVRENRYGNVYKFHKYSVRIVKN